MEEEKLKVLYKKSMDHNYLVADLPGEDYEDYRLEMILENDVAGLLKASVRMNEGRRRIYYEISSMQPLGRIFEHKEIKREDAAQILRGVVDVFKSIREYMLSEGGLILDPEYLFVDPESLRPMVLYMPWKTAGMQERLLVLMEYLMEHTDPNDAQSALWTYRLYKAAKNENCVLGDIEKLVAKQPLPGSEDRLQDTESISVMDSALGDSVMKLTDIYTDEEEEEENERRQGLLTRIFGSRSKNTQKKEENKASKKSGQKVTVPLGGRKREFKEEATDKEEEGSLPDFSEAFADMEKLESTGEDYGKTVFVGQTDAPLENLLVEKGKGRQYRINSFPFTIGKVKNCVDLPLSDSSVSRIHARIFSQNGHVYIQDCHSTNGTYINGVQLEAEEQVMLEKEDEIGIGKVKFNYM